MLFRCLDLPVFKGVEDLTSLWCSLAALQLLSCPRIVCLSHQRTFPVKRIFGTAASFCAGSRKSMHRLAIDFLRSTPQIRSPLSVCLHISAGASIINLNIYKHFSSSPFWCELFQQTVQRSCSNSKASAPCAEGSSCRNSSLKRKRHPMGLAGGSELSSNSPQSPWEHLRTSKEERSSLGEAWRINLKDFPPHPWSFLLCKQQYLRGRVFLTFGSDDPTHIERLEIQGWTWGAVAFLVYLLNYKCINMYINTNISIKICIPVYY